MWDQEDANKSSVRLRKPHRSELTERQHLHALSHLQRSFLLLSTYKAGRGLVGGRGGSGGGEKGERLDCIMNGVRVRPGSTEKS